MTKKQKILWFLIVLPLVLGFVYDKLFRYSGNWLEDYQNYFKFGFILLSLGSSIWLLIIAKKEQNKTWLSFSILSCILLLVYLYMGFSVANMNI
jgi:hypothetical protein